MNSGGLLVALPCASAKRSRFLPEVFDDCSCVGRKLSPRDVERDRFFAVDFWDSCGIRYSESCKKVVYSILSTGLSSPVLHCLHSVISDFRPLSGAECGEAALGVYSLTSNDPAPGSLTVSHLSRVARPQDASKAPTRLGPAGWYVDPVFQHSWRYYVGFISDLVNAGSVGFVEQAVEYVGLFC